MKRTVYASLAILAAIAAACNKQDIIIDNGGQDVQGSAITLKASAVTKDPAVKDASATKVAYGAADATWEAGDKIFLVRSDGTTISLTLSGGEGTTSGDFVSTDPVVEGTYIPYAVSATALDAGFVSISDGAITLNLAYPGGGTLNEAMQHDVLKGTAVNLSADQNSVEIAGLTTHFLSYLRFRFTSTSKAVESVGMQSAGGLYQTVTIAADGTVTGSDLSTDAIWTEASSDGEGTYSGYFAVYDKTTTSLVAHAADVDGGSYSRLVTVKDADYDAGTVYGKAWTLTEAMVTAAATGTLSGQNWKNLGLSVKWAEFNVGSSSEYSYDRNISNTEGESAVPAAWSGWRHPTRAEVQELFYASNRSWITGTNNGVQFSCNGNYVAMGAGGRYRWRDDGNEWDYNVGSEVCFYIDEITSGGVNGDVRVWAQIQSEGSILGFGSSNLGNNKFYCGNTAAMRLVCDY